MQTIYPSIQIFDRTAQGLGSFDLGKITEYKVIGMPHDGAKQKRIGPLFYWAWASGKPHSIIALHPHRGFEIFSYILQGTLIHRDTLGIQCPVHAGGIQVMQTGYGVSHEEVIGDEKTEFFQIWLEPNLQEAMRRSPTYQDYGSEAFPIFEASGVRQKQIIGTGSPVQLDVPISMLDIQIEAGATFAYKLSTNQGLAALAIEGSGIWNASQVNGYQANLGDLAVVKNLDEQESIVQFTSDDQSTRLVLLEIPLSVNYPLYFR